MSLSLKKFCHKCQSKCCKPSNLIGSPILDKNEYNSLGSKKYLAREIIALNGGSYWILDENNNRCPLLGNDGLCSIESNKPLDCLCYPVKAIYKEENIVYIIDADCPASGNLDDGFIEDAKQIALKSIKRFKKETYEHWLNNYVGWVKKGRIL